MESLVIFFVFSNRYIHSAATIENNIAERFQEIPIISHTTIHKKLAFAIVCPICTSLLITIKFQIIALDIEMNIQAISAYLKKLYDNISIFNCVNDYVYVRVNEYVYRV
jgi:hypothetical protein